MGGVTGVEGMSERIFDQREESWEEAKALEGGVGLVEWSEEKTL